MNNYERAVSEVAALQQRLNDLSVNLAANRTTALGAVSAIDLKPVTAPERKTAPNDIRNGDYGHSVNTWNEAVASAGDKSRECAFWFSHDAPSAGQQLDESTSFADLNVDGDANVATNKTLKYSTHSTYDANYSDWDRSKGQARLQGTKSLDAPFPSNLAVAPGRTKYLDLIVALASKHVVVPAGFRLWAGLYDNTAGQRDFLKAASAFSILSAAVRGTPAATRELRYRIYATTDRGYSYLSAEFVQSNAPSNADFSAGCDVYVSWQQVAGVLEYKVYRFDPVAVTYRLVATIDNGSTTCADNNSFEATATGYPAATDDREKSYVATATGSLDSLAVDGVSAAWSTLFLNIPAPSLYNQGNTTDKIWLRLGANMALDRRVTDAVVNNGSTTIQSATAAFTSLDTGRTATVSDGVNSQTVTLTFVDATHATMSAAWAHPNAAGCSLYIVGGGDHGLLIDLVHCSNVENASFSPYPDDLTRPQQPNAAPNGSTQGGLGTGGGSGDTGDGGVRCVAVSEPVLVFVGDRIEAIPFSRVRVGDRVVSGDLLPNVVREIKRGHCPELWRVRTENGAEKLCSPSHRLITGRSDAHGRAVSDLRAGDFVLTFTRDHVERSRLLTCEPAGFGGEVGTFILGPGHIYVAGREVRKGRLRRALGRLQRFFGTRPAGAPVGLLSHNVKNATA